MRALELFPAEGEEAKVQRYRVVCRWIVDALSDIPGPRAVMEHDGFASKTPVRDVDSVRSILSTTIDPRKSGR